METKTVRQVTKHLLVRHQEAINRLVVTDSSADSIELEKKQLTLQEDLPSDVSEGGSRITKGLIIRHQEAVNRLLKAKGSNEDKVVPRRGRTKFKAAKNLLQRHQKAVNNILGSNQSKM